MHLRPANRNPDMSTVSSLGSGRLPADQRAQLTRTGQIRLPGQLDYRAGRARPTDAFSDTGHRAHSRAGCKIAREGPGGVCAGDGTRAGGSAEHRTGWLDNREATVLQLMATV